MKIGILTFHRAINYGAVFQAYALLEYLRKIGHNAEIVDYWPDYHQEEYKIFDLKELKKRSFLGKGRVILEKMISYRRTQKRNKGCNDFMREFLDIGENPLYKHGADIKGDYDLIICGSDQIWRKSSQAQTNDRFDSVYWGAYPISCKKKISFAASMGIINPDEQDKMQIAKLLQNFSAISVREKGLVALLRELNVQAELSLDPVFLLDKAKWIGMATRVMRQNKKKYLLFYHHNPSPEAEKLANHIARLNNWSILEVNSKPLPYKLGARYINTATPTEFLGLVLDAEFVVTTSFHGVAFSIILNKPFLVLGLGLNSERAISLLENLGLENRYINDTNNSGENRGSINFETVNSRLQKLRNDSFDYLAKSLV